MKITSRVLLGKILPIVFVLFAGLAGSRSAHAQSNGPCDIFSAASTPCVAAYSTTRALYASYTGALYQVTRQSDSTTQDIGVLSDGYANAATQDTFCNGTTCTITEIYDQSSNGNNLTIAPPGGHASGAGPSGYDLPAIANAMPLMAGGHKVYGLYIQAGMGYRNDSTTGIAVNGQPEGVYMVSSDTHLNKLCCFDFGNAETNNDDNGKGHMDALNIRCSTDVEPCDPITGLDMENGIYGNPSLTSEEPFVTVMGANDGQNYFYIYQGNAQSGSLATVGQQSLPSGYSPMKQEGAIILGIGGDNSNRGFGNFFEGVMTQGAPTSTTMGNVQSNIVSVGYTGLLPYHDGFAGSSVSEWTTYDGSWSTSGNTYVNSTVDTNGDKAVTGAATWDNYTLQGDVNISSGTGDAGLILRVNNPSTGANALQGYYVGVSTSGNLLFGRQNNSWTQLHSASISGGISTGVWYHLTAQAIGCTFTVSAQPVGSTTVTSFSYTDTGCTYTAGMIGVRSYNTAAAWRDVNVDTGGTTSTVPYYAPFASGTGPSGWTTYDGTWSFSGESYVNSAVDTNGDKSIGGPTSTNLVVNADVELTSSTGNAGLLVRATDPAAGADSVKGYYLGVESTGSIVIGKENYGWTQLGVAALDASPVNTWVHLTGTITGCQLKLTAQFVSSSFPSNEITVTDCSFSSGQVGVRTYDASAQWQYLSVTPQ